MQTAYRIVHKNGTEIMRGRKSWIIKKLATRALRDRLQSLFVEKCRYEPAYEECPPKRWRDRQPATEFVARSGR